MCGVIGTILKSPSNNELNLIRKIFHESKIRGMHATGLSYVKNEELITVKESVSADKFEFLDNLEDCINEDGNLYLIGHCRYSTSDLEYNQPISNGNLSVVHNGVVTQELFDNWKLLYGYECSTKNDSELLLHTTEDDNNVFEVWKDSSMGVCTLNVDKTLTFYRNGKRPLYFSETDTVLIVASTKDILHRSGLPSVIEAEPFVAYGMSDKMVFNYEYPHSKGIDLQRSYG